MAVVPEVQIVDDIPDAMKRLASFVVRAFYGNEHGVVIDLIKRNTTVKEETLRELTRFDPKYLRQLLIAMKTDKLLKERQVQQHRPDGRPYKSNYFFINYRALLNVSKYKLDHMRQKLESREKDDTHRASYQCTSCKQHYDVIEVDKLWDPYTQLMTCWRCQGEVEEDATAGPSQHTRSLLAQFNDQMAPLFSILQQLDGVQLAPHLLEPPLVLSAEEQATEAAHAEAKGTGARGGGGPRAAHDLYGQRTEFTVTVEGAQSSAAETPAKELPAWLREPTINASAEVRPSSGARRGQRRRRQVAAASEAVAATEFGASAIGGPPSVVDVAALSPTAAPLSSPTSAVDRLLAHEAAAASATAAADGESAGEDEDSELEDVVETEVRVQGRAFPLGQVSRNPSLVAQMTPDEKDAYVKASQEAVQHLYGD